MTRGNIADKRNSSNTTQLTIIACIQNWTNWPAIAAIPAHLSATWRHLPDILCQLMRRVETDDVITHRRHRIGGGK